MLNITYNTIIIISWAVPSLVWSIGTFRVKREIKGGCLSSLAPRFWLVHFVIAAIVLFIVI
jgi:hypothetical protein